MRSVNCLCGLPKSYDKDSLVKLLKNPESDMGSAISFWGSKCTCDVQTLQFNPRRKETADDHK